MIGNTGGIMNSSDDIDELGEVDGEKDDDRVDDNDYPKHLHHSSPEAVAQLGGRCRKGEKRGLDGCGGRWVG